MATQLNSKSTAANSVSATRAQSAPAGKSQQNENNNSSVEHNFDETFKVFAKFGDANNTGDTITLSNSDKWFKQAKVIDGKRITTTDTGIYFKQIAKAKKAITLQEYLQFLESISKNKKVDLQEMKNKLSNSGPPATTKTTTAVASAAVARLTDHTKYTGSHKQRFDETGKGRGKAGRVDIPNSSGYVTGFKHDETTTSPKAE